MRVCPKCGDYFEDGPCAFCLNDGTPLTGVNPQSQHWADGARSLEKKNSLIRRQARRLRLRRIAFAAMTIVVATVVVLVVVANGKIYLTKPDAAPAQTPSPTPTPALTLTETATPSPTPDVSPAPTPMLTETPTETPTPSPTVIIRESQTPTPPQTPTPTRTVIVAESQTPTPPQTPTPDRTVTVTESPTPTKPECTDADRDREKSTILNAFGRGWKQGIEREPPNGAVYGGPRAEVSLRPLEYSFVFRKCNAAAVTVRYTWQLHSATTPDIKGQKNFICGKILGMWGCGELRR
jgi:hypothetical protein